MKENEVKIAEKWREIESNMIYSNLINHSSLPKMDARR